MLLPEYDFADRFPGLLGDKILAVGTADVQNPDVEPGEVIAERVARLTWLSPEPTLLTTRCGLNHLPRLVAFGKLRSLADAKRRLLTQ